MAASTITRAFTRSDYMRERIVSHHDYYSQFVTDDTIKYIRTWFDPETLADALAKDEHLNSIPLTRWDALAIEEADGSRGAVRRRPGRFYARIPLDVAAASAASETITRAVLVCIAKCAARIIINKHLARELQSA